MPEFDLTEIQNKEKDDEYVELNEEPVKEKRKYTKRKPKEQKPIIEPEEPIIKNQQVQNESKIFEDFIEKEHIKKLMDGKMNFFEPIESPEDKLYKTQLIEKIKKYKSIFHEFLKDFKFNDLNEKNIMELETLLSQIKNSVSSRNMSNNMNGLIQLLPTAIETGGKYIGLQLEGYSGHINSQKEYYYTCQEILIESNFYDKIQMTPTQRLGYILGSPALMVHIANSQTNEKLNQKLNTTINGENFKDL